MQLDMYVYLRKHLKAGNFKPGVRGLWPHLPGFLKLLWFTCWYVCVSVCVCVCASPGALINSGMMWCDIGRAQLAKQASLLLPAFNYFI